MQLIILLSLVFWNYVDPTTNLALVITVGLIIAIASATQDITVDALRIEQIGEDEGKSMQAGAAMAVVGWWTGYKLGGVIALNAAEYFEKHQRGKEQIPVMEEEEGEARDERQRRQAAPV